MPTDHALLSASSSHMWLKCTPSARLQQKQVSKTSVFADEGSAAHALAEHKLREFLKMPTRKPVSEYDSPELDYYTDQYVEYACELISEAYTRCKDPVVLIEQRLSYSHYAPEGFGTGDLVIVSDGCLDIADLKYGKGIWVSAEDNTQLKLYALGALAMFDFLYDIEKVRLTICQPRLDNFSTYELSVAELVEWAENELKPKAELAFKGAGEFAAGEHCRFCKVRATCRARAEWNLELAKMDFREPAMLTDDEIAEVLNRSQELGKWVADITDYVYKEALAGRKKWKGYKLIQGKGRSRYTDEEKVAETVLASGEFNESQIFTKNIIGITAMRQLLGKKRFEELLKCLVHKPPGKPALVPESHKGEEWNPANSYFEVMEE